MALTNPRLAAGVGAVSAVLLLGGPGVTAAFADPGGSRGSDRGNSSERGESGRDGDGRGSSKHGNGGRGHGDDRDVSASQRRGSDGPQIAGRQGIASVPEANSDRPQSRVGSGRDSTARLSPDGPTEFTGGSGSDGPSGASAFEPPQVTFGNGRSPGIQSGDPEPRWQAPAPSPADAPPPPPPPPPAPAPPTPSWVDRIATPPAVAKQFVVAPAADLTDPLWGIAGLLLIPAAGAVLGYRQARAAQSAERLHRP